MMDNVYPSYIGIKEDEKQMKNYLNETQKESKSIQQNKTIEVNANSEGFNNKLIIGINDKKKDIYISESSRYLNTLVLGLKGTGKTTELLPNFVMQDLKNNKVGATIIVTKKEMAYSIYSIAKKHKRKIVFLKPSISNEISNKLLWQTSYNYDYINEFIINYKEAIKKKKIVIIDMEILKYKSEGLRAVAMLLLQLQLDIQETDITQKTPHYLYIDDAQYYLPFIEHLLSFSDNFNLGIMLFMQSRNQLTKNGKDYSSIIDNNIRTTLLLNSLTTEDIQFYSERFYEHKQISNFYNRKLNTLMYETVGGSNKRACGLAEFKILTDMEKIEVESRAKKERVKLLKKKRTEREKQLLNKMKSTHINSEEDIDILEDEVNQKQEDYNQYDDIGEPKPFDLEILDENDDEIVDFSNLNKKVFSELEESKEKGPSFENNTYQKKINNEELKEMIFIEEKEQKRKVSSNIFNKLNADIDYCNDNFDFQFD